MTGATTHRGDMGSGRDVFTLGEARRRGLTRGVLQGARFQRLFQGVYASAGPVELEDLIAGARLVLPPDAVVSGVTALRRSGLDLGADLPVRFRCPTAHCCRHRGIALTVAPSPPGLPPLDSLLPADAVADLLSTEPLPEAVQIADRALHLQLTTLEEIRASPLLTPAGRVAFHFVRVGAQSVRETQLRLVQVLAGLPCPLLQAEIIDPRTGRRLARVDQLHEEQAVILEYEGDQHRTERTQWNRDIGRYDALSQLGYRVIRVTIERLRNPQRLVEEVYAALRDRGWRGAAPRLSPQWRVWFSAC